jgi:hypothetical protein
VRTDAKTAQVEKSARQAGAWKPSRAEPAYKKEFSGLWSCLGTSSTRMSLLCVTSASKQRSADEQETAHKSGSLADHVARIADQSEFGLPFTPRHRQPGAFAITETYIKRVL